MENQKLIDKYLNEFYEVQKIKVPIELNSYLNRMLDEALSMKVFEKNNATLKTSLSKAGVIKSFCEHQETYQKVRFGVTLTKCVKCREILPPTIL